MSMKPRSCLWGDIYSQQLWTARARAMYNCHYVNKLNWYRPSVWLTVISPPFLVWKRLRLQSCQQVRADAPGTPPYIDERKAWQAKGTVRQPATAAIAGPTR